MKRAILQAHNIVEENSVLIEWYEKDLNIWVVCDPFEHFTGKVQIRIRKISSNVFLSLFLSFKILPSLLKRKFII